MKIAVSAKGQGLDSPIDPRFGRAPYFIICDATTQHLKTLPNDSSTAQGGAGIQAAQLMADEGVTIVITGSVGPKAEQVLTQAGIKVYNVKGGCVCDALKAYEQGNPETIPNEPLHSDSQQPSKKRRFRVAIATDGDRVAAHFGHCPHYTIVDVANGRIEKQKVIPNPGHRPGFLPGYLADLGINYMISGGMGANAEELFDQRSVKAITGVQGQIDDVIKACLDGKLTAGPSLCDHDQ
ncbi:MAG: hypothetical protein GX986_07880 [Firmicutes bacterium]|nr:hypothetical protein [Bacillota bacterium]